MYKSVLQTLSEHMEKGMGQNKKILQSAKWKREQAKYILSRDTGASIPSYIK
jgi:hypothetical protein